MFVILANVGEAGLLATSERDKVRQAWKERCYYPAFVMNASTELVRTHLSLENEDYRSTTSLIEEWWLINLAIPWLEQQEFRRTTKDQLFQFSAANGCHDVYLWYQDLVLSEC